VRASPCDSLGTGHLLSSPTSRKLVVIDGANAIYRAFFAIPSLRAPDGTPTNAALGFATMLAKVLREEAPDLIAVAFDPRGGSFRKRVFEGYKAGRDAQPEDLSIQIPLVREIIDAFRIPLIEVPDFEADDVIGTLVAVAPEDVSVTILSTDKDLMQLVGDRVTLVDGIKDRRYEPADVEKRFGVPPEKMLDLRALVGDPSDNIPGVKGIGEKGAAKLILEWGTLEALLENAGEVKAKRAREALVEQQDEARLSKELATLREDVELPCQLDDLVRQEADLDRLREIYHRLGFTRLIAALDQETGGGPGAGSGAVAGADVDVEIVSSEVDLKRVVEGLATETELSLLAVAEPGSAVDANLIGLALATGDESAVYLALADESAQQSLGGSGLPFESARPLLEGLFEGSRPWGGSEVKHIQSMLAERGLEVPVASFDVPLAAFLLDPNAMTDVSSVSAQYLSAALDTWEDLAGRGAKAVRASDLEVAAVASWAARQVCAIRKLHPILRERLDQDGLLPLFRDVEVPLTRVLSGMERAGVRIDEAKLEELAEHYREELGRLEVRIYEEAGEKFLVSSPKQLQVILFEKLKLTPLKKTKTGYSTAESVLEQLAAEHELPVLILAWRRLSKLMSTYIEALPPLVSERTGRIHPTFNQTGAATGRMSATNPNVQNIPIRTEEGIRVREAFVPAEGCVLLSADYSQVELRVLAHYSGDESLVDAFTKGEDIHRRTAAEVAGIAPDEVSHDQRARAKAVNFGIIYGSSAFGLSNTLKITPGEAQETIDAYFARYQGVRRFLDETIEDAKKQGYVKTLLDRRRYLPDLASRNRVLRQAAERMAVNSVIQGTAADLIKKAMVDVDEALDAASLASRVLLQVHDELVFEVPTAEVDAVTTLARETMQDVFDLRVPLVVDVGTGANWREAH
jgi:DNA polymerase-1